MSDLYIFVSLPDKEKKYLKLLNFLKYFGQYPDKKVKIRNVILIHSSMVNLSSKNNLKKLDLQMA